MKAARASAPAVIEAPRYPSLYQINTRVWLTELSQTLGRHATLDDIPDGELDRLPNSGSTGFMENHDEPRAAATFSPQMHEAAAIVTYLTPGLRFFHQGQFEGRRRRISPHLVRAPLEPADAGAQRFYDRLLTVLQSATVRDGEARLLECIPAWIAHLRSRRPRSRCTRPLPGHAAVGSVITSSRFAEHARQPDKVRLKPDTTDGSSGLFNVEMQSYNRNRRASASRSETTSGNVHR